MLNVGKVFGAICGNMLVYWELGFFHGNCILTGMELFPELGLFSLAFILSN